MKPFKLRLSALCGSAAVMLIALTGSLPAQPAPLDARLSTNVWPAYWITPPMGPDREEGVFYFRKSFHVSGVPKSFLIHVSADNRFQLRVNGHYAGEGPARGDLQHWRFETYDIAPLLHAGDNVIASVVWNWGVHVPMAQMSDRTAFLVQGNSTSEDIVDTNDSWLVERESGRSSIDSKLGFESAGYGELVDGRRMDWSWDSAGSDKESSEWMAAKKLTQAATRGAADAGGAWKLMQDPLPAMLHLPSEIGHIVRLSGVASDTGFPDQPLVIPAHSHAVILLDRKTLQTAYPILEVSGGRNADISLTYSEALYDRHHDKGNRNEITGRTIEGLTDRYVADGGTGREFTPLWWRTWRYLQLDVKTDTEPITLERFHSWFTAYPFVEKATMKADIPDLDAIWETSWRTAWLCAHETYMDSPYWEQLQYAGDSRIEALLSYTMTGDSRLAKQVIGSIDDSRVPEGITQSRYPSAIPQFIPPFSLLWVGTLHDYWMYVDDPQFVRQTVPHTRSVLDWFIGNLRPDGLLGRMPWWEFGDWTENYINGVPPQDQDGG
jgi:alpha-L-rhamnosidase